MNRINAAFRRLAFLKKPAFIAYVTAGDPNLAKTALVVKELAASGCDIIELGIPFSDPLADGVVNQRAAQRALASGTTLAKILAMVRTLRKTIQVPVVLFSYFNPIHRMGIERFAKNAAAAGVDGVLILDLPPEESGSVQKILHKQGIKMIYLAAPTSSAERIAKICARAEGFVYCVSRTGVTGSQQSLLSEVQGLVRKVKKQTSVPVAVGFGISQPGHVRDIGRIADGVVVGSAIVAQIEKHAKNPVKPVGRFVRSLTKALENHRG